MDALYKAYKLLLLLSLYAFKNLNIRGLPISASIGRQRKI